MSLSPASEAVVRLLTATGLSQFDDAGVKQVTAAVEAALAETNFAGQDAAAAASTATQAAGAAPIVQQAIENNRGDVLRVGQATGVRGGTTRIAVTLNTGGETVAGSQNDLAFAADARIAARPDGKPDCTVNPAIRKRATSFAYLPAGCSDAACTGMRAFVLAFDNVDAIPQGAELYTCTVAISPTAPIGTIPLTCAFGGFGGVSGPDGRAIPAQCAAGAVIVTS